VRGRTSETVHLPCLDSGRFLREKRRTWHRLVPRRQARPPSKCEDDPGGSPARALQGLPPPGKSGRKNEIVASRPANLRHLPIEACCQTLLAFCASSKGATVWRSTPNHSGLLRGCEPQKNPWQYMHPWVS
jgi:hypothetical protein